ncbi:MAG: hypothetical protein EA427_14705 [Spirochaetaceae bacterium]|nr:MAG: hypothetical protein EA427_14705 [Spirochaetaceae bacterium]
MSGNYLRTIATVAIPFGTVLVLLSLWLLRYQESGSGERVITEINIAVGVLLMVAGFLVLRVGNRKK